MAVHPRTGAIYVTGETYGGLNGHTNAGDSYGLPVCADLSLVPKPSRKCIKKEIVKYGSSYGLHI